MSGENVTVLSRVFTPVRVGRMNLKNRLANPSHAGGRGALTGDDELFRQFLGYYIGRAKGGAAWVGGGPTFVGNPLIPGFEPTGVGASNFSSFRHPLFVEREAEFMRQLHAHGAYGSVQFVLMGSMPHGASAVSGSFVSHQIAHEMEVDEIETLIAEYRFSAAQCRRAGVDALEVHANHDDVVEYFLSPLTNKRTDAYGGSTEKRLRFLREVLEAMREGAGDDITIGVRLNMDQVMEGGYHIDEAKRLVALLTSYGLIDYFSFDVGTPWGVPSYIQPVHFAPGTWAPLSGILKQETNLPAVYVGRVTTVQLAEQILAAGQADVVGMNRAMIADPDLANKAQAGRFDEIRPCVGVNDCIHRNIVDGIGFGCALNTNAGHEASGAISPATTRKRILVVGGGPGGMEFAALAAERGHAVILWEQQPRLGGAMALAAKAPMQDSFQSFIDFQERKLRRLQVAIELGRRVTAQSVADLAPDVVVVATGAAPRTLDIPGASLPHVVSAQAVMAGTARIGKRALVIAHHDHMLPLSVADYLASNGHDVHVVYQSAQIAPNVGRYTIGGPLYRLNKQGVRFSFMLRLTAIAEHAVTMADVYTQETRSIGDFDTVVIAASGAPENGLYREVKASGREVHILGDAYAPRRITFATRAAEALARVI